MLQRLGECPLQPRPHLISRGVTAAGRAFLTLGPCIERERQAESGREGAVLSGNVTGVRLIRLQAWDQVPWPKVGWA